MRFHAKHKNLPTNPDQNFVGKQNKTFILIRSKLIKMMSIFDINRGKMYWLNKIQYIHL